MKPRKTGRTELQRLLASCSLTVDKLRRDAPFVPANSNWVIVHFEYPRSLLGAGIWAWQKFLGVRFPRAVHVSFALLNGERYDRCWLQTLLGVASANNHNGLRLLVPTPYSNETIAMRALEFLVERGETRFDCADFVVYCLGTAGYQGILPGDLLEGLLPFYYHAIKKFKLHGNSQTGEQRDTATPTQTTTPSRDNY
ncbi:hypothetical protein LPP1_g10 [Leptolyngbya phage LPP-1]|uniref:Uncharacterized protein n=1 Tax=Leptolyngbya phage LPP-1 TaxID=2996049 RepID=A0AAE9THQ8_9CAUD|nr:hypothetical protein LPP1_g10 [Leptolyngbya phage LPP-1]